jgi:hypothetical protein
MLETNWEDYKKNTELVQIKWCIEDIAKRILP